MASKNDQNFIAFCDELRGFVEEHRHFPNKHTNLLSRVKYTRKKIKEGKLEDWKLKMFNEIAEMRDLSIPTGGRKPKAPEMRKLETLEFRKPSFGKN